MTTISTSKKLISMFGKYYLVIIGILVLVVLGGGYYLFIQERVANIKKVGTVDLESKLNTKQIAQNNLDKLIILNDNYSKISKDGLDKLAKVLPTKSEIPFLLVEIDRFVTANELILGSLDIGPLSVDETSDLNADQVIKELNITLTVSGIESYTELKRFLQTMSEQLPLIELSSLNYNEELTSYGLNLTTYYQ